VTGRPIRVLLIDGHVEDSRWIQELLADFNDSRFSGGWMHGIEIFHLVRLSDALTVLGDPDATDHFDVVLLNPTLPDSNGIHTYMRLRGHAPNIPIVVLSETDDPDLALSMVRNGAQDFLAKSSLDCVPLARSLRLAIERNRLVQNLRGLAWNDELTGLYNHRAFEALAEHDLSLARRHCRPLAIAVITIKGLEEIGFAYGRDEQQLALIECADLLRSSLDEPATLARIDDRQFAITLLPAVQSELTLQLTVIERRFHRWMASKANRRALSMRKGVAWRHPGDNLGIADLLAKTSQGLCENVVGEDTHAIELANRAGRNV
jgi:diguanylate cyclase (GGDEF)-like protein